jgi:hypothetical protein
VLAALFRLAGTFSCLSCIRHTDLLV